MRLNPVEPKDPDEIKTYTMDWTNGLNTGATLSTSTWTIVPSGLTEDDSEVLSGSLKTSILLSGGTSGVDYACTNRVTTSDGETLERTGIVSVRTL